ncbi:hypothetical protein [Burkholderia sp. RF4-BP95]|uniref:hypothetical protein n=1 Tax=Burkholderia sp. RF4-BP95 TaxID=1637845 RepID=UPI0012E3A53A|nr:hypothetical protein [Burkholderia sp. RF4-BP95]
MATNEDAGRGKRVVPAKLPPKYEIGESLDFDEYVDGVASTLFGAHVSKVTFYSVAGLATQDDEESAPVRNREIRGQLVMPTSSLIRFCIKTLESVKKNKDKLDTADDRQRLLDQLDRLLK